MVMSKKVFLIAGAGGRVGSAICKDLYGLGANLILMDKNQTALMEVSEKLDPNRILTLNLDVLDQATFQVGLTESLEKFKRIDGGIFVAYPKSRSWGSKFGSLKKADLFEDLGSQLGGTILFCQALTEIFLKQKYGHVILFSSIQGITTPKFDHYSGTSMVSPIEYSAIKSGVISVTKYLAKLYRGTGLQFNCISPGGITANQPASFSRRYKGVCNTKGLLDPGDIAPTVRYLLSPEAAVITGQNIVVDDGWSL